MTDMNHNGETEEQFPQEELSPSEKRRNELDELQAQIDKRLRDNKRFLDRFMDEDFEDEMEKELEAEDEDEEPFEEL
jgi:hypothetical protein